MRRFNSIAGNNLRLISALPRKNYELMFYPFSLFTNHSFDYFANMPPVVTFQTVTFFMIIPSTILTAMLLYITIKASTAAMKKYKYIIILVMVRFSTSLQNYFQLSVYQFDFVDSVLLCPINVYKFAGLQFYGVLGTVPRKLNWGKVNVSADWKELKNIPRDGFYLMVWFFF